MSVMGQGLGSMAGDAASGAVNFATQKWDEAKSKLSQLGAMFTSGAKSVFGGGFSGIKDPAELQQAITKYSQEVQQAVNDFQANAELDVAIKGEAQAALHEFIEEVKKLLDAYAASVQSWNAELTAYYSKYQADDSTAGQSLEGAHSQIQAAMQTLEEKAGNISMN